MAIDVLNQAALEELVLPEGQFGYDQRANVLKVGDGVTPWPGLKGIMEITIVNKTENVSGGGRRKLILQPDTDTTKADNSTTKAQSVDYGVVFTAPRDMTVYITAAGGGGGRMITLTNAMSGNGGYVIDWPLELKEGESIAVKVGKGGRCAAYSTTPTPKSEEGGDTIVTVRPNLNETTEYMVLKIYGGGRLDTTSSGNHTENIRPCYIYQLLRDANGAITGTQDTTMNDPAHVAHTTPRSVYTKLDTAPLFGFYGRGAIKDLTYYPVSGVFILEYDE